MKRPRRLTLDYIKKFVKTEGYTCLLDSYRRGDKILLKCPNNHIYECTWANFQQGFRCRKCYHDKRRTSIEEIKNISKNNGFICLSKTYRYDGTKLKFKCSKGHIFEKRYDLFKAFTSCPICNKERKLDTIDEIKKIVSKKDYQLLTTVPKYIRKLFKIKVKCPKGHIYDVRWGCFEGGSRCPVCKIINFCGPNHPNWKGGITADPYCDAWLDKEYKDSLKERDGNKCLNPYCFKTSKKLVIHHIDYDKKNCHPLNLITMCDPCNGRANKDRDWHTSWYQAIIYRRYIEQKK